jgi:hypothetical protein
MQDIVKARRALQALGRRAQTVELAAGTGIHQSQVSRLLRGQFRRVSPNVRKLLAYKAQPARRAGAKSKVQAKEAVIRAALRTWDETPEGARALVRLLRSVEGLRRARS